MCGKGSPGGSRVGGRQTQIDGVAKFNCDFTARKE